MRKPTQSGGVSLRPRLIEETKLASADHSLQTRSHAEMATEFREVLFYRSPRQPEDTADVAGALALLDPSEAFELPASDQFRE